MYRGGGSAYDGGNGPINVLIVIYPRATKFREKITDDKSLNIWQITGRFQIEIVLWYGHGDNNTRIVFSSSLWLMYGLGCKRIISWCSRILNRVVYENNDGNK